MAITTRLRCASGEPCEIVTGAIRMMLTVPKCQDGHHRHGRRHSWIWYVLSVSILLEIPFIFVTVKLMHNINGCVKRGG